MLMAEPAAALAETRRVLRRGETFPAQFSRDRSRTRAAALPSRVLQQRGHVRPQGRRPSGMIALADRDRPRRLIAGAGFSDPQIEDVAFMWRFANADEYWAFLTDAAGAIAMVLGRPG
jgi:hypothetical protein